jgi:bacterioferritin-associated ferredoxin
MYVCLCNAITDRQVREAVNNGANRPREIYGACGCVAQCGTCATLMRRMLDEHAVQRSDSGDD